MTEPSSAGSIAGPDFVGIGAQKAGTGWLYDQLRDHPDFWMPPMKELHYFDRLAAPNQAGTQRSLPLARQEKDRIRIADSRARSPEDKEFLTKFEELAHKTSLDLDGYAALFALRRGRITGDITPGYSTLPASIIEQLVRYFPRTKFIFIARDPVERAWSQLSMYVRRGLIDPFDGSDVDVLTKHLDRPEIRERSFATAIVRRWREFVRADHFGLFFFDDLKRDPIDFRSRIIAYLGGDPGKSSGQLSADHNAKAEKPKLTLTDPARKRLAQYFRAELQSSAAELGGAATDWPKRYGF